MNVLVTGGAGFIGSHTVNLLLERGHRVRILDNLLSPVHRERTWPAYVPEGVERILGSVDDPQAWKAGLVGMDSVLHLAAYQDYLPTFSRFFHTNAAGTALLYELLVADDSLAKQIKKIVVATSQAVYGEGRYHCTNESCPQHGVQFPGQRSLAQLEAHDWEPKCTACDTALVPQTTLETDPPRPHNQYGISKLAQELVCLNLGERYGFPTTAMRYSITQGPHQSFTNPYSGALRIFIQRLLHGRQPVVYEDGGQLRDYVAVWDVARANVLALEDSRTDFQAFNVGGGKALTVLEYAQLVGRALNLPVQPALPGRFRLGDTRHILSDISKLRALGWEPRHSLEEAAQAYAAWAQQQPGFRDYSDEGMATMAQQGVVRG
ncbi:MAG: UDP-glucose 4-epimerase [uncultured Chloroflexi bacterium]|uniref:UDP-glucose 4-epimerase n=1 Tax=uncultured Chloroflexota bacterium TaxID=166587 RepID=A0A6J4K0Z7_9CHLR|nr:MAG: UDP-glucose 4-epimerase [uncultured Chloroflexota bacterium]